MHSEGSAWDEMISKKEVLLASMEFRSFCIEYEERKGYSGFSDLFFFLLRVCSFLLFLLLAHVVDTPKRERDEKGAFYTASP
jgi:hypothetical protein